MKNNKIVVGITQGDINGVGYEVIIKALSDNRINEFCTPVVYGSPKVAAYHKKVLDFESVNFYQIRTAADADAERINIVNCCDDNVRVELGKSNPQAGEAAYMAIEQAVTDLKEGNIDVLVTAPINKQSIQSDIFNFPGHTEFLASQFEASDSLMLLISDSLKVGVVTGHIPVKQISETISAEMIISKVKILHDALIRDFACTNPRIAVLGLNPHAGDDGVIGDEEQEIIKPALKKLFDMGITALGPYPADGFFGSMQRDKFDAVLAMYHDQGLAPFKALAFDNAVNYTAGLSIIRTSPGHGTAFDIAGQNIASGDSFRQAIYTAIDIFRNRKNFIQLNKNKLRKYEINANGESDHVDLTKEDSDI